MPKSNDLQEKLDLECTIFLKKSLIYSECAYLQSPVLYLDDDGDGDDDGDDDDD